jgi:hypothetical protein
MSSSWLWMTRVPGFGDAKRFAWLFDPMQDGRPALAYYQE